MLYLSGILLSFFLFFVLLAKKGKSPADKILVAWLCLIGIHLFAYYFFSEGNRDRFPSLMVLGFALPLVHSPLLYLYTLHQTSPIRFKPVYLLHFLPVLGSWLLYLPFHFLPQNEQVEIILGKGIGFEREMQIHQLAIYLSGIVYVGLSLNTLLKYRRNLVNQFSNTERINFNWLLYLIIWMMLIWIVIFIAHSDKLIFTAVSLFVIWIGFFGIRQEQVFNLTGKKKGGDDDADQGQLGAEDMPASDEQAVKYQRSPLSMEDVNRIYEQLKNLMFEKKPFINPDLTLNELAGMMEIHPNHLSQVINSKEHKNFYDLVNERRIEEFKKLTSTTSSQRFTLLALAFECGFNSKASFNRNFKKYTGLTPSDYLKTLTES